MVYKLRLTSPAEEDISEAIEFYESRQPGLGGRFFRQIEKVLFKIEKYPELFQVKRKSFREALVPGFPYLVIFEISAKEVVVYSVFHASRSPDNKP